MYTYLDTDDNRVLSLSLGSGPDDAAESFWDLGGWTDSARADRAKAGGAPAAAQAAEKAAKKKAAKKKAGGAKYRHERSSGGGLDPLGPVESPWRGQGPNAPFDQAFYLILNLAVGGTNGYFPGEHLYTFTLHSASALGCLGCKSAIRVVLQIVHEESGLSTDPIPLSHDASAAPQLL